MSLGLIERGRRAGLPAVGVVGDEWMVLGAARGRAGCARCRAPAAAPRALAERLTGLPARASTSRARPPGSSTARRCSAAHRGRLAARAPAGRAPGDRPRAVHRRPPARRMAWRLLYLGRMDERKGVHVALDALAELPPEATLVLQGRRRRAYVAAARASARRRSGVDRRRRRSRREPRDGCRASTRTPTRCCSRSSGTSRGASCRSRRWPSAGRWWRPARGGSGEYLRTTRTAAVYEPRDSAEALAAAVTGLAEDAPLRARLRGGRLPHGGPLQRAPLQRGHRESACGGRWRELRAATLPCRAMTTDTITQRVDELGWYHTLELAPGT